MLNLLFSVLLSVSYATDLSNAKMLDEMESVKKPIVVVVQDFDENGATVFARDFQEAVNTGQNVIPIIVDSYGGSVYSLFRMIDTIKSSPVPVATIVMGKAMSAGAVMLAVAGTKGLRFAAPNSTILVHDVSSMSQGKINDLRVEMAQTEKLNKTLFSLLDKACGKKDGYFSDLLKEKGNADLYMTPDEALKHGLIDVIKVPKITLKVKTEVTVE